MLLAPQTRPHDAFLPPETKPSTEPVPVHGLGRRIGGLGARCCQACSRSGSVLMSTPMRESKANFLHLM
jgi:hypothetical protein